MIRPVAALLVVVALIGLAPAAPVPKHLAPKEPPFNYPTARGTKWVYETEGGGGEYTRTVTGVEEKNGATFLTIDWTRGEHKRGQVVHAVTNNGVYIHAEGARAYDPPLLYFKFPCRAGDTWTSSLTRPGSDTDTSTQHTIGPVEKVKVLAGEFRAVRVDTETSVSGDGKRTQAQWFANGIGLVKAEKTCALKSFTPGKE